MGERFFGSPSEGVYLCVGFLPSRMSAYVSGTWTGILSEEGVFIVLQCRGNLFVACRVVGRRGGSDVPALVLVFGRQVKSRWMCVIGTGGSREGIWYELG